MHTEQRMILIIDEGERITRHAGDSFRRKQWNFVTEPCNAKTMETVHRLHPDLIILDWQMSKRRGMILLEQCKRDRKVSSIPVIVMSEEKLTPDHAQYAFAAGASDVIDDHAQQDEVNCRIDAVLNGTKEQFKDRSGIDPNIFNRQKVHFQEMIERNITQLTDQTFHFALNKAIAETFGATLVQMASSGTSAAVKEVLNEQINHFKKELFTIYWAAVENKFLTGTNGLATVLVERYPSLTLNDLKLCLLFRMNLSNKEISEMTFISYEALRKARTRLRKKLSIDSAVNLTEFLKSII